VFKKTLLTLVIEGEKINSLIVCFRNNSKSSRGPLKSLLRPPSGPQVVVENQWFNMMEMVPPSGCKFTQKNFKFFLRLLKRKILKGKEK